MILNVLNDRKRKEDAGIDVIALTDKGPVREHNEDSLAVVHASGYASLGKGSLLIIADGMGGMEQGEIASSMITSQLPARYFESTMLNPTECLIQAICEVNQRVHSACGGPELEACMGSTVIATVVVNDTLITANVGDSRAYLLHDGSLRQLSRDHSLRSDFYSPFQATDSDFFGHVLTQAIGPQPSVHPHVNITRMGKNDVLLLCSDGLTAVLSDSEIREILLSHRFEDLGKELLAQVYCRKGDDNVSLIVARNVQEPAV